MVHSRAALRLTENFDRPHALKDLVLLVQELHDELWKLERVAHQENKEHHEAVSKINALANDLFANRAEGKLGEEQDFVPVNVAPCL